jgi:hypothetical protein
MLRVYQLVHMLGQLVEDAGWMLSCWGRLGMMEHVLRSVDPQDEGEGDAVRLEC